MLLQVIFIIYLQWERHFCNINFCDCDYIPWPVPVFLWHLCWTCGSHRPQQASLYVTGWGLEADSNQPWRFKSCISWKQRYNKAPRAKLHKNKYLDAPRRWTAKLQNLLRQERCCQSCIPTMFKGYVHALCAVCGLQRSIIMQLWSYQLIPLEYYITSGM